jgi:hypothetical protein
MIDSATLLTPAIRTTMRDALVEAITGDDAIARYGASLYLADLDTRRDGEALGDLIDVVEYFQLDL